jgi:trypsin
MFPNEETDERLPWESPPFVDEIMSLLSQTKSTPRIVNGDFAELGQFPHVILLLLRGDDNITYFCGGSLIKRNWILTAANCFMGRSSGIALAGTVDFDTVEWDGRFNKSQIFIHPDWNPDVELTSDIALVKLRSSIPCNKYIGTIDIQCGCDVDFDLNGLEVTTTGYGYTNITKLEISPLKYMSSRIIKNEDCKKLSDYNIYDSMICVDTSSSAVW